MEKEMLWDEFYDHIRRMAKINIHPLLDGITKEEYYTLEMIGHYLDGSMDKRGVNVSVLAENLQAAPSAVSRILGALERKKLITRTVNEENRRSTLVWLTNDGKELRAKTNERMHEFADRVLSKIGLEDMCQLIRLWDKLIHVMEKELQKLI